MVLFTCGVPKGIKVISFFSGMAQRTCVAFHRANDYIHPLSLLPTIALLGSQ